MGCAGSKVTLNSLSVTLTISPLGGVSAVCAGTCARRGWRLADEQELIRRAQAGNADAFAALVAKHQRFVHNLALRTVRDADDAEDIAQEAFVRMWRALGNFRGQAKFRT